MSQRNGHPEVDASLIVPVFCSESALRKLHTAFAPFGLAIIYVDDASTDGSLGVLSEISGRDLNVQVIGHQINRGQSAAILTGISAARTEIIVTLDDDLQYGPDDVLRLLAAIAEEGPSTLVVATADSVKRPLWRGLMSISANAISNLFLATPLPLRLTTFCAFHKCLCANINPGVSRDFPLMTALVQAADKTRTVPVRIRASLLGSSRYGLKSLFCLFVGRSGFYRLSKVVAWTAVASLFAVVNAVQLTAGGISQHPIWAVLLLPSLTLSCSLITLAIKVASHNRKAMLRANRSA